MATFARNPGQKDPDNIIDFNTKLGVSLYNSAITPVEIKFDGDSKNISLFQNQLLRKGFKAGWGAGTGDILNIPDDDGNKRNILTEYGCLTKENITTASEVYMTTDSRAVQNNDMMLECILGSLTEGCFHKIANEESSYTLKGTNEQSATLLYKLLMAKSIIDTVATTYQLRNQLDSLEEYMTSVNSNIELFNMHVKSSKEGLKARGQTIDDLTLKLFRGYKAASDSKFVDYIEKKEESHLDGETVEDDALMHLALNKYAIRKQNNLWGAPSAEQEQITALSSELDRIKKSGKDRSNNSGNGANTRNKGNSRQNRVSNEKKWAWKRVPPKEGEPTNKTHQGRTYDWCVKHQCWCMYTTQECKLPLVEDKTKTSGSSSKTKKKSDEAMQAVIETVDAESDDESEFGSDEESA